MNLLDYIIVIIMVFLVVKGVIRGIIREFFSLAGIGLGIWLGIIYQPELTDFLNTYIADGKYLPLLSIAAIFATVMILCNVIGWAIKLLFKKIFLGWLDKGLGAGFAIVKGIVIIYVAIVLLTFFVPTKTPLIAESELAPWIIRSYQSITSLISSDLYEGWKKRIIGEKDKVGAVVSERIKDIVQGDQ